ncbi:hypothetical protein GQ472_02070 [archaeon]|nr:hypothetical protein [archaeon]
MDAKNNKISPISAKISQKKKDDGKNGIFWIRVSFLFAFYSLMLILFYSYIFSYLYYFTNMPFDRMWILFQIFFTNAVIGILSGIIAIFKKKKLAWLSILLNVLFSIFGMIMSVIG